MPATLSMDVAGTGKYRSLVDRIGPKTRGMVNAVWLLPVVLWLGYVVVVNVMLTTKLVAKVVSYNPTDASLAYGSAWSLWPGVVHIKDLRLSGSDSVLQWGIELEEAAATIHLTKLFWKEF